MNSAITRQEIEQRLITKAWQDDDFKQLLVNNPRAAMKSEGIEFPESFEIRAVEETPNTVYIVLPTKPSTSEELSEADLEAVAGGAWLSGVDSKVTVINNNNSNNNNRCR